MDCIPLNRPYEHRPFPGTLPRPSMCTQTHLRIVALNSCICLFPAPCLLTDQINYIALTRLTHPCKTECLTDVHISAGERVRQGKVFATQSDNLASFPTRRHKPDPEGYLLAAVYVA